MMMVVLLMNESSVLYTVSVFKGNLFPTSPKGRAKEQASTHLSLSGLSVCRPCNSAYRQHCRRSSWPSQLASLPKPILRLSPKQSSPSLDNIALHSFSSVASCKGFYDLRSFDIMPPDRNHGSSLERSHRRFSTKTQ